MWPVPMTMTMQRFGVMALALALGARIAVGSVGLYLVQGAFGLPLFAGGGGIAYMFGPTGGYLLGFLAMARLVGLLGRPGLESDSF
jgi:biotin transport system substrate-specific component